jgi:hypothetical protein
MNEIFKLIGVSAPFMYAVGIYGLFHWLDKRSSAQAKSTIGLILRSGSPDRAQVSLALVEVFDWMYTRPLLSPSAFGRSLVITLTVTLIFIYESSWFGDLFEFYSRDLLTFEQTWGVMSTTLLSLLVNILADYVSLFVIRRWLTRDPAHAVFALFVAAAVGFL